MTERFILRRGVVTPPYERCKALPFAPKPGQFRSLHRAGRRGEGELAQRAKRGWSGPRRPLRKREFWIAKNSGQLCAAAHGCP